MENKRIKKALSEKVGLSIDEIDDILSIETLKQFEISTIRGGSSGVNGTFPECLCYADCGCNPQDRFCDDWQPPPP